MQTTEAAGILKLDLPTTRNALKTAFRRMAKLEHPDQSKHPDANARVARVKEAYDWLTNQGEFVREDGAPDYGGGPPKTETGELLADLGKGLGPTTNGRPCSICRAKGYTSIHLGSVKHCPNCVTGTYPDMIFRSSVWTICHWCHGARDVRGHHVQCRRCRSTGSVKVMCSACNDTYTVVNKNKIVHYFCQPCQGTGEVGMFNPALAKGLLTLGRSREK